MTTYRALGTCFKPLTTAICIMPIIGLLASTSALATDASLNDPLESHNNKNAMPTVTLEPIIVTARGVIEDQLETPFVVNTVNGLDIEDKHHTQVKDVIRNQPSMDVHDGGNAAYSMLWMRGTGSLSMTSLDDNSVDIRIDDVSNGKTGLARNLFDIEQVEVAKGPQGTLLGSSAEAGSIAVKTRDPVDYLEGKVGVGMGNRSQTLAEAVLNVPLADNVAVRVAGMTQKEDNYFEKSEDGNPLNDKKSEGVQVKLRWQDDDANNKVVLSGYHDTQTNNVPVIQNDFSTYKIATFGLPHDSESKSKGVTLAIDSDLDFAHFESQTGYHSYFGDIYRPLLPPEMLGLQYDLLGIPANYRPSLNAVFADEDNNRQYLVDDTTQWTQELKLVSNPEDHIKWVTGIYFAKKNRDWLNDSRVTLASMPASPIKDYLTTTASNGISKKSFDSVTKAVFGEITYPATSSLDVIAGIRVANERLEHRTSWEGNSNNALATGIKADGKTLDETATTGRLGLSYAITPNWRAYALQSRGHKFGGFADYETNVVYGNPLSFYKPTHIDASEIGTKYRSEDGRLNLGLALYQNIMNDDHISVIGAPPQYLSQTANVDSRSRGVELSADWQMTDNWRINTELAYTDAEVTDASNVPDPQIPGQLKLTENGNKMPQVPEFSGSIGAQYHNDLPFTLPLFNQAQWFAGVNYRYVGDRYAQSYNVMKLDSYGLLDANIGIRNDNHELNIWGKNLTDDEYLYIGVQPGSLGTLAPDRSYGIKYSYYY